MSTGLARFLLWICPVQLVCAPQNPGTTAEKKGATVSGTAVNSLTGEPVCRVEVVLTRERTITNRGTAGAEAGLRAGPAAQSPVGGWQQPRGALSGADGSFRFENFEEGEYTIYLRRKGMVPGRAGAGISPQRIRVVADTPVTALRYTLAPHAVLSRCVLDEEGEPVQGARILVLRRFIDSDAGVQIGSAAAGAQTGDRGHFRVGGLAPGALSAECPRESLHQPLHREF